MPVEPAQLIRTKNLVLHRASKPLLLADLNSPAALSAALGAPVAEDWPPLHWDAGPLRWLIEKIEGSEDKEPFWWAWYVRTKSDGALVGTAGFKGPPGEDGFVEVGYGVATSRWRRGIASEACGAVLAWALFDPRVKGFRAHTLAGDPASGGVLLKNGFTFVRTVHDPEDGDIDRYERGL